MGVDFTNISRKEKGSYFTQFKDWVNQQVVDNRLNSPLGYLIMLVAALCLSVIVSVLGLKIGVLLLAVIVGGPLLLASMFNLRFGLIILIITSFFVLGISRFVRDLPLGTVLDAFVAAMFFGVMIKQIGNKNWNFIYNPVSVVVILWIVYNLIQLVNPSAASRLAWLYTIRSLAGMLLIYFIALKAINSVEFVSLIFKVWIVLAFLGALYGLKQEFFGFSPMEHAWVLADEERFSLFFNWGRFRRFSFFSDPTVFGILMAYTSILCFVLMTGPLKMYKKVALGFAAGIMLLAMVFTGTRTAYAVVPVGVVFFTVITLKRNIILLVGGMMVMGAAIIFSPISSLGPLDSNALNRIRSAFIGEEDPSYNVRLRNQEYIQPYIWSHPIGWGLGSVGVWGMRFSPGSPVASFPPDSGFVRIAVEQGWIGLILYSIMLFVLFRYGVRNYLLCEHPKIRLYYVATLTVLFSLMVANYPQQAYAIFPTIVIFYICMAIVVRLKDFDNEMMRKLTGGITKI